ncbi:hypothetical protein LOTGIDRAFT_229248 [Lottia gigantea]|uniref:Cadherin domain-containing protein n=1 Tax=Lottia gigantea TaxID=225164 RepID=V3Z873_LOTGI|nr:hypothetical protein LOTGIDRAFT_229248 [Lottia gigantea]ESO87058.1 hypothetical protein LOTGIDRAFT_229248 [Lottia gigantea]
MLSFKGILVSIFLILELCSQSEANTRPRFKTQNASGAFVDGNLYNRLTVEGILESMELNADIGQLKCEDAEDDDAKLVYTGNGQTVTVESDGFVVLNRKLDKENSPVAVTDFSSPLRQTFRCTDSGGLFAEYTLTITITDTNDNAPVFSGAAAFSDRIREDSPIGTQLSLAINVTDRDQGANAEVDVTCYIGDPVEALSVKACEYFGVRTVQNGQGRYESKIYLKKKVDYEQDRSYLMTLLAKDRGVRVNGNLTQNNSTANIIIEVLDAQDSPPEFINIPVTVYVQENTPINTPLTTLISAQDQDDGSPRPVKIKLLSDPLGLFSIGETAQRSGQVFYSAPVLVKSQIDREVLNNIYTFTVEAVEMEGNVETNAKVNTTVTVNIQDVNDNKPVFTPSQFNVNLTEVEADSSAQNSQVPGLNIQVTDADEASNAEYDVRISSQTFPNTFRVFPEGRLIGSTTLNLVIENSRYLDYDQPNNRIHIIKIEATEVSGGKETSTATVTINLLDLNDNFPVFDNKMYNVSVREDKPVGSFLIKITATDGDQGSNGNISYSLRGTDLDIPHTTHISHHTGLYSRPHTTHISHHTGFRIDSTTGDVYLEKALDFEEQTEYPIIFVASDNGKPSRESTTQLSISVTDVNDVPPRFLQKSYSTYVFERSTSLQPPVIVQATDPENPAGRITYRIVDGNIGNAFRVDPNEGNITLTRLIDYDETVNRSGIVRLVVQASDIGVNGQSGLSTNITVTVNVQDENNHIPRFNPLSYNETISEIESIGRSIVQVIATDSDLGSNGEIRYSIDRGGLDNFEINPISGVITVSSRANFDYDAAKGYSVVIYATDRGSPPQTGTATVFITLTDANNKPPVIKEENYNRNVPDNAPIGTLVIKINATDTDSTSLIRYSLPTSLVRAKDKGGNDIYSYSPFDYRYAFIVDEVTGEVTTNLELSRDSAAEITFTIRANDTRSESGVQTANTEVTVTVLGTDISDIEFNPPWTKALPQYNFNILESREPGTIMTLTARDPACGNCILRNYVKIDEFNNNQMKTNYFTVNRTTGEVRLNDSTELDYEIVNERMFRIVVEGRSNNTRVATATVVVEVNDDNDNIPEFLPFGVFTVGETEAYPKTVGTLKATDKDSGSFGLIEYSLAGQRASDFFIFKDSGLIIVAQNTTLDFETKSEYNLQAIATDNPQYRFTTSEIRKQTSVPLKIQILDQNDNEPVFPEIMVKEFYTVESYPVGSEVGQVNAEDRDGGTNGVVNYFLTASNTAASPQYNAASLFRVNHITGIITTRGSLRGESVRSPFQLSIIARDLGNPQLSSMVNVLIHVSSGQLNDGSPFFSSPLVDQIVPVSENAAPDTDVIKVIARARTNGASIEYSFLTNSNPDYQKFDIDPFTGKITVTGDIDHELTPTLTLIVRATDNVTRNESYRLVNIKVTDENDNEPSFKPDQRYKACLNKQLPVPVEIELQEQLANETFVYRVVACDPDAYPSNRMEYFPEMSDNNTQCKTEMEKNDFIVARNGSIYTNKVLDREIQEVYLVCVRVQEVNTSSGRKKREVFNYDIMPNTTKVAYVEVKLTDLNDNRPIFPFRQLQHVLLSVPVSESVRQVTAIDKDAAPFNRVRYSIIDIRYFDKDENFALPGSFLINPDTGMISVGFPSYTDFSGRYFKINILAEDFYDSRLNDTAVIYVYIFDKTKSLKFVLDETPDTGINKASSIIDELNKYSSTSGNEFKLQQISYHTVSNGNTDVTKTDVCFVMVRDQSILTVQQGEEQVQSLVDYQSVLKKYNVMDTGSCYLASRSEDRINWRDLWWVLVAVAIFIFICCIILIIAIIILHRNYKRYMNTRKTYMVPQ